MGWFGPDGSCSCCGCQVTCGQKLYFGVTGVVDYSVPCAVNNGFAASVIASGDSVNKDWFNNNDFYWDYRWTTVGTPNNTDGIEDESIVDSFVFRTCGERFNPIEADGNFFVDYFADYSGFVNCAVGSVASVVARQVTNKLVLDFLFQVDLTYPSGGGMIISRLLETWQYPGACSSSGSPTRTSRTEQTEFCCDFTGATINWSWV